MGGFISGIGITIILMQVPKLFGGSAGTGELIELGIHIWGQLQYFNVLSAVLGFGTVVIILVAKKYIPKFPMSVVLMVDVYKRQVYSFFYFPYLALRTSAI